MRGKLHSLTREISAARSSANNADSACSFEKLEPRILLSADLLGGAVATDLSQSLDNDFNEYQEKQQDLDQLVAPFVASLGREESIDSAGSLPVSLDLASLDNYLDGEQGVNLESANAPVFADGLAALFADTATDITVDSATDTPARQEIIFIDAATPDYQQLVEGIATGSSQTQFLVFILDDGRDGVEQIGEVLADYQGIDAIHLISHGSEGQVNLGSGSLNTGNVNNYAAALTDWQKALDGEADLLIYGCNLAGNAAGQDLLQALAQLTGADIAASDDLTGSAELGGDWDLEYQLGQIETAIAFNAQLQQSWQNTLATFTVNTFDDTIDVNLGDGLALDVLGNTSLRAAIMQANNIAGDDTIILGPGTYTLDVGGPGDDAAVEGDLDIRTGITITGADAATTVIDGGGIDRVFEVLTVAGSLTMTDVTVQGGVVAGDNGGGINVSQANADMSLNRVIVTGNQAADGAGIYIRGTANLTDVTLSGNNTTGGATSQGGGLYVWGTATLDNVTVSGNTAGIGGGIYNEGTSGFTNVTISGNIATGAESGGLHNTFNATLTNVTVSNNTAQTQGGGISNTSSISISNTIVANNVSIGGSDHDVSGTFTSDGSNVIEDTGVAIGFGSDTVGDPNLGALADSGGFTQTHALLDNSIAIDAGTNSGAPADDQRGYARADGLVDVGAYEATTFGLVWVDQDAGKIQTANIDGSGVSDLLTGLNSPLSVAVDAQGGKVYWSDDVLNTIQRANLDGTGVETIVTSVPGTIAIDLNVAGGKIYWVEGSGGQMMRADLDGTNAESLTGSPVTPTGIALDVANNKVYWADAGNDRIKQTSLTGGATSNLISSGLGSSSDIALDLVAGQLYWSDSVSGEIRRVDLDGTNLTTVISGPGDRYGLAIDSSAGKVYWTDDTTDQVHRANLDGSGVEVLASGITTPRDIDVVDGAVAAATTSFVVTNTNATGAGSLEQAILDANAALGFNTITFNIPGAGPHFITVDADGLPDIDDRVFIDGWSEPDYLADGIPVIQVDGSSAGAVDGLRLLAGSDGSTIRGLSITNFSDAQGIDIRSDSNSILGNYLGVATDGTTLGNNNAGIILQGGASDNQIGDTGTDEGNLVTGGSFAGIQITGTNTDVNRIQNNDIGLDATGTVVNVGTFGIGMWNGPDSNEIGGTGADEGNRIAGFSTGIIVDSNSADTTDTSILGNQIWGNSNYGINLENEGITPNDDFDLDSGSNDLLNYPVLSSVANNGPNLDINFNLDVPAGNYRIEFFDNPGGISPSGYGGGENFLDAITVVSTGTGMQSMGASLIGVNVADVKRVTATVTEDLGGGNFGATSEFSRALPDAIITATKDTYVNSGATGSNYGISSSLVVDKTGGSLGNQRALLEFDLSSLPVGATITSATLQMQSSANDGAFEIDVYRVLQPWDEGVADGTADASNWNERQDATNWTSAGGDADELTKYDTLSTSATGQHFWDITSLVTEWYDGTFANNGLMLASDDLGTGVTVTYYSSEAGLATAPQLLITYDVTDLDPVFTASGSFDLNENSAVDTVVGDIDANDGDGGAADAGITYDITSNVDPDGDGNDAFKIDSLTGVISVNDEGDLDFEGTNPLNITVEADDGVNQVTTGVTINLNNINEAPTVSVPGAIFINEIHYDNIGADTGEAIEIAGVAGNDLNGWTLALYNGFDGSVYDTLNLSGTIPNQADNFGTLAFNFPANGIQNATSGNPDGLALVDPTGTVVQFLSYEGAFTATEGPANGMLSTDIGVAEDNGSTAVGDSLQLTGSGATFTWTTPSASNFGAINTGQDFAAIAAVTSQTIDEDTSLVFSAGNGNAITVDDVDAYLGAASDPVSVKLDVSNGTLTLGSTTDLGAVLGDGTNSIAFTGTIAELNAALEGLIYQPNPAFSGSDTLGVLVDDLGNAGAGGNLLANGTVYITIDPVNDAPTLSGGPYNLGSTDEDTTSTGVQVSTILAGLTTTDDDGDTLGIAVTAASGNGSWEYSTDSTDGSDGSWTTFGTVTPTGTLVLSNSSWVRYVPDNIAGESVAITFRAWDGTQDSASTNVTRTILDPGIGGGSDAYSTGTAQASLTVTDVNDAPLLDTTGTMSLLNVLQDNTNSIGDTVADILLSATGNRITDPDVGDPEGIAVIGVDNSDGRWEYSTDAGDSWNSFVTSGVANGTTDNTRALLLDEDARIRFVPNASHTGSGGAISFQAWDQTTGSIGQANVDVSTNGDATAFSADVETAGVTVSAAAGISNSVPGAQPGAEDTTLTFSVAGLNPISVSDGSADDATLRVTLSSSNGTLTLAGTTGISIIGGADGSASMTLVGLESAINTALDGLEFDPDTGYTGAANVQVTTEHAASLEGHYSFDDPATLATLGNNDTPDGGPNATITGATAVLDGTRGQVLGFDGNDTAQVSGRFSDPADVTLAAWVNLNDGASGAEVISIGDRVILRLDMSFSSLGVFGSFNNGSGFDVTSSGAFIEGTGWHHVAYTIDDANNSQNLYIDGQLVASTSYTASIAYSGSLGTAIGSHANGSSYFMDGMIDDARIFSRALNAGEINALASGGDSATSSVTVNIAAVNSDPTLDNAIGDQAATEDSPFSYIFAANTFGDADGDTLTYTSDASGWLSFNAATRTFSGTPLNGDVGTTTVTVTADDGNGGTAATETFDINVANTNDAPLGAGLLTGSSLNDNAGASNLFGGLTVSDVDTGENDLVLRITLSDDTAGTISGGGFSPLGGGVYTATGLTVAQANTALDNAQFTPTDNTGSGGAFTTDISVDVDDGDAGYQSLLSATTVTITQVNDDPTLDNAIANQSATEESAFTFTFAANTFGDVDGDTLTYTSDASGWLSFNAATRTFSGTPLNGDVGTTTVTVTADDGNGGTPATETFDIVVANTNDDPTLDNAIGDQAATEDTLFNFTFAANSFGDVDAGDTLTYSSDASGWLSFNAATRTFSGTPLNADVGTTTVTVTADDGNGGTAATETFDIVIANSNDDPTLDNAIANQSATEESAFTFTFAANTFGDVDGDTLTYTSDASGWLSFNAATHTFSGTPLNGDVGTTTVTVTADDGNGGTPATETFDIVVANTNDDPTLDNAIGDQAATEDTLFNFTFAANSFGDIDVGDTLTYTAQLSGGGALPAWLGFDSATRTFSGTPLNDDVGTISVEIVADDGNGGTPAIDAFDIVISNQNDAPTGPVTISGTLAEGEILTATYTLADDDGLGPLNYQWQRNGVDIAGATSDSYTLTEMDAGAAITMLVSYTDARGTAESVSSNALNFIVIVPEDTLPEAVVETPPEVVDTDVTIEPETDTEPQPDTTDIIDTTGTDTTEPAVTLLDEDSDESVQQISAEIDRNDTSSDHAPTLNDPQSINTESGANLITMQAEFTPYNDPLVLVNFQGFVDGVDELREEIADSKNTTAKVVGSTFAVSAGLSAGYVAWLARSGAILSSVLSALPAWRFIDPLPVLTRSSDGSEDEESLQSMIHGSGKDVDVDADGAAQQAAQEEEQIDDQADNPDGRE